MKGIKSLPHSVLVKINLREIIQPIYVMPKGVETHHFNYFPEEAKVAYKDKIMFNVQIGA